MEGEPSRGFERILARLDDAVRARFCCDALEVELREVQRQLQRCAEAMAHARQVHEATRSLAANAVTPIRLSTPAVAQALDELQALGEAVATTVGSLVAPARDRIEKPIKTETATSEEMELIAKAQSILTKKKRETWLKDALDTARSAVRVMETIEAPSTPTNEDYTPEEAQVFEVFKLLRKALLKHVDTHADELRLYRKLVRRLARKRPIFQKYHERCEVIIADRLERAAKSSKTAPEDPPKIEDTASSAPAKTKSKKRKLSEASDASSTPSVPRNVLDIRSKAQLCSSKANALGDVFALSSFDVCLKLMIEVVNALTPQFSGEDTELVGTTLGVLVNAATYIKAKDKHVDRLVCLESLLSVLVSSDRIVWTTPKQATEERLAVCRQTIESLRRQASTHTNIPPTKAESQPPSNKKKAKKPTPPKPGKKITDTKPTHKRFDDDDDV